MRFRLALLATVMVTVVSEAPPLTLPARRGSTGSRPFKPTSRFPLVTPVWAEASPT